MSMEELILKEKEPLKKDTLLLKENAQSLKDDPSFNVKPLLGEEESLRLKSGNPYCERNHP